MAAGIDNAEREKIVLLLCKMCVSYGSELRKEQKIKTGFQWTHDGPSVKEDKFSLWQFSLWKRP